MINNDVLTNLLELNRKKSAWIGENKLSFPADKITFTPDTNFRLSPTLHGKYDIVWLCEKNLFSDLSWPVILDEALRLLGEQGMIITQSIDNNVGSIWELKAYLFRHPARRVALEKQLILPPQNGAGTLSVFNVTRLDYSFYQSNRWSIGVITNGKKNDNVVNLITKLKNLSGNDISLEFIVAGPFDRESLQDDSIEIKTVSTHVQDDLARISEKKALIGRLAKFENVAIFHDRYQVDDNFFTGFDKFGYDFDFLSILQSFEDGTFLASNLFLSSRKTFKVHIFYSRSPDILGNIAYVNGGLMIFKKNVLNKINFNPLLLHNEAEDLELSLLLRENGIIPRLNIFSSAVTVGIPVSTYSFFRQVTDTAEAAKIVAKMPLCLNKPENIYQKIWFMLPASIKNYLRGVTLYKFFKKFTRKV